MKLIFKPLQSHHKSALRSESIKETQYNLDTNTIEYIQNKDKFKKINLKIDHAERFNTNFMLLIVCILFLIAEFPHSILLIVSILNQNFYNNVYKPLGDLMDILVLINNSINFLLYVSMSKAFRLSVAAYLKKK